MPRVVRTSRGFTLIELLTVVAVISLLAAVSIPSFVRMASRARQAEPMTNLRAAYVAANAYFVEHDTYVASFDDIGFQIDGKTLYNYVSGYSYAVAPIDNEKGKGKGVTCQNPHSSGSNPHCRAGDGGAEVWDCTGFNCTTAYTASLDACGAGGYKGFQSRTAFCFVAFGQIDFDQALDVWNINMNGALNNGANYECGSAMILGYCSRSFLASGGNDVHRISN